MNASSKLFTDFENQTGYLKRPGETLAMLQNMAIFLRQQEEELENASEQQQQQYQHQSNNLRYMQQFPDRFPEHRESPRAGVSTRDSDTDMQYEYHQRPQQQQQQGYEDDRDLQDQEYASDENNNNSNNNNREQKNPERMSLAEILWTSHRFQSPSNQEILKELPYILQGISSSKFTYVEPLPPDENSARNSRTGNRGRNPSSARTTLRHRAGTNNETEQRRGGGNGDGIELGGMDEDVEDDDEQTTTVLTLPPGLPWPMYGMLNKLMEPAVLYRNISETLKRREERSTSTGTRGLVMQALNSAIDHELRGYMMLVGVIESEVRRQEMNMQNRLYYQRQQQQQRTGGNAFANRQASQQPETVGGDLQSGNNNDTNDLPPEAYSYGVGGKITLTNCIRLLNKATLGLRLIHNILQDSESLVGGQLLSLIHSYTYNGDQLISEFATRILPKVARPFFEILNNWILSGQLTDPHHEFFVKRKEDVPSSSNRPTSGTSRSASSLWEDTFLAEYKYLPDYIPKRIGEQIFQIGKTLHFIVTACDDREWVDRRKTEAKLDPSVLYNPDLLQQQVSIAYKQVVRHLNDILRTKFHLGAHLRGLKDYLLLGKGDFVQLLVESVAPVLDKAAIHLFRHHLTATLETAVRGSNALLDHPDVLRALDARMLELGHGDIGWDVFTLDYRVDKPLDTVILDRRSVTEYLRVFNFLWRIKRVSFTLNTTWRQMTAAEREATSAAYLRHPSNTQFVSGKPQFPRNNGSRAAGFHATAYDLYPKQVSEAWRLVRKTCGEMLHFISELEYYINYEVIEMAWVELINKIQNGELSVDELIAVHKEYLRKITYKGLLGGGDLLMGELHDLLKTVLAFGNITEGLHDITQRLRVAQEVSDSSAVGHNLSDGDTQNNNNNSILVKRATKIHHTVQELKNKFEYSVQRLVIALDKEEDSEMRFLSVRLDFNGFYSRLGEEVLSSNNYNNSNDANASTNPNSNAVNNGDSDNGGNNEAGGAEGLRVASLASSNFGSQGGMSKSRVASDISTGTGLS